MQPWCSLPGRAGASRLALALLAGLAGCGPSPQPSGATWPGHRYLHASSLPVAESGEGPALGSHAILAEEQGFGHSPARTPPIDTARHGSWFLLFNGGYASNAGPPADNKGNLWTALGTPVVYEGYDGAYAVGAWLARSGRGGVDHVVTLPKSGAPAGELTLPLIELRGVSRLADVSRLYAAAGDTVQSGEVSTTGPAVLVALWWGDGYVFDNHAVPGDGFTEIERVLALPPGSAVQCAVAYRRVDRAGHWRVSWRQAPRQGAVLWLLAFDDGGPDAAGMAR